MYLGVQANDWNTQSLIVESKEIAPIFLSLRHLECILGVPKTFRVGLGQFMATDRGGSPCILFCWCCCNEGSSLDVGITYL